MKLQFIDDVRGAWKLLSVNVSAIWAGIFALFVADPMLFVSVWNAIPAEIREYLPPWVRWVVAASAMLGTIYLARIVKQPVTKAGAINEEKMNIVAMNPDISDAKAKEIATKFVEQDEASRKTVVINNFAVGGTADEQAVLAAVLKSQVAATKTNLR